MVHLSIVIPAYNEEKRIAGTLNKLYDFLKRKNFSYEVIVVDDGSTDNTVGISENSILAGEDKLRVIRNGSNTGKGFSVKNGILNSNGEYVLFSDADMSVPIEEVDKFFDIMGKGYDIIIGSRGLKESDVRMHQPWYREMMGRVFNLFVKSLLMSEFNDTQCGFKLFKADPAKYIASQLRINGFSFDVEMLYIAAKIGYRVKEMPVIWLNSPQSRVNPLFDSARMFFDLIRIRVMHG